MTGSSWVSSPPCNNVLCWSAVWGREGHDCAYGFQGVFSLCFCRTKTQRHGQLKHIQIGFKYVHGHLLILIQSFDSEKKHNMICVLNVYPLVDKRHIAQSCIPITGRNSDAGQEKEKLDLQLNIIWCWININWQRCRGVAGHRCECQGMLINKSLLLPSMFFWIQLSG